jgi:hypothetical protein
VFILESDEAVFSVLAALFSEGLLRARRRHEYLRMSCFEAGVEAMG